MRLPIVKFPKIVQDGLPHFAEVFSTTAQQKHFCEYVTGLMVGDKKTITAINELYLNKNDQSSLNKFLTQAPWDEQQLNRLRVEFELQRMYRRSVSASAGRLVIDDTLAHHTLCGIEELAYLKDHALNRYVWAHNLVTSYYINRSDQFPVDLRLYLQVREKDWCQRLASASATLRQTPTLAGYHQHLLNLLVYQLRQLLFQTKTQLAADLVRQAVRWDLPFSVVLFDSWFCRWPLIAVIQEVHKDWIAACPKDRLVLFQNQWQQVQAFLKTIPPTAYRPLRLNQHLYWTFSKVLPMKCLQRQRIRIVASYEDVIDVTKTPNIYVTGRRDWEAKHILTTYLDRWPTETFNEDAKGYLGLEAYQLRKLHGIMRHWYLSFVAYSLLGNQGAPGHSRWAIKQRFESTGQRCRAVGAEMLSNLIFWIAQRLQEGKSPESLLQTLLA
jgi:hypothetical protein